MRGPDRPLARAGSPSGGGRGASGRLRRSGARSDPRAWLDRPRRARRLARLRSVVLTRAAFDAFTVFVVLCCLLYELPASAVVALQDNLRAGSSADFARYRLLFSAFAIGCCGLNLVLNRREYLRSRWAWGYLGFVVYMLAVVLLHHDLWGYAGAGGEGDEVSISAPEVYLPILYKYVLYAAIGLYLIDLARYRAVLLVATTVALVSVLPYVSLDTFGIDQGLFAEDANAGNYQFIGDALAISALLVLAWYPSFAFRVGYALFAATVLFFVGSRASFALFVVVFAGYLVLCFRLRWIPGFLAIVLAGFVLIQSIDFEELADANPRMFGIFIEYDEDNSIQNRSMQSAFGWQEIREHPLFGNFGGQLLYGDIEEKQDWFSYMHDIFSYWRQFGLPAMAAWVLFGFQFARLLLHHLPQRTTSVYAAYALPAGFLLLGSVLGRSFAFSITHLFFGLALALIAGRAMSPADRAVAAPRRRTTSRAALDLSVDSGVRAPSRLAPSRLWSPSRRRSGKRKPRLRF